MGKKKDVGEKGNMDSTKFNVVPCTGVKYFVSYTLIVTSYTDLMLPV
jgi:hypothetical protein